jgi:hypothetical protein
VRREHRAGARHVSAAFFGAILILADKIPNSPVFLNTKKMNRNLRAITTSPECWHR